MRLRLRFVGTAMLSVLALACSSKDDPGAGPKLTTFAARFELSSARPEFLAVPFPSDLQLAADGTIALEPEAVHRLVPGQNGSRYIVEALRRTQGFGVYAGAIFELTGEAPDVTKLPKGLASDCQGPNAPVYYVDLDAGTALPCQAGWSDDQAVNSRLETTAVLTVRTARGHVIPEGHRVAVLLTSGVVSKSGAPLRASAQFASIRAGDRSLAGSKLYGDAIDAVVAKTGTDRARIVSAAVYTTGKVTRELRDARELARATPLPILKWGKDDVAPVTPARFTATTPLPDGWTATLDDYLGVSKKLPSGGDDPDSGQGDGWAHDAIASIGVASFDAPNFLIESTGYGDPAHGTFFHEGSALAINPAKKTARIWVSFYVPKGPMPAAGWPVIVYQHGMGGQRGEAIVIANSLATRGWATASIDLVLAGTRGASAVARGDDKSDYKRNAAKYTGPDGFTDRNSEGANEAPNDLFGNLFRLAALRDQFRQAAIDHTTLLRLLKSSPTLDGLAEGTVVPKIDGNKVAFLGDSLGGIVGSLVAGIEPDHSAYILNVAGGALLGELASNSPTIYSLLNGSAALNFGFVGVRMPPWHPLVQLMQHVVDGGDPIAVGSTAIAPVPIAGVTPKPRNMLLLEVLGDELVPNQATDALARTMGIPVAKPHLELFADLKEVDGAAATGVPTAQSTAVMIQISPAEHGHNLFSSHGKRVYDKNRPQWDADVPFPTLPKKLEFANPYLELQTLVLGFIGEAFDGKVPTAKWTKQPAPLE